MDVIYLVAHLNMQIVATKTQRKIARRCNLSTNTEASGQSRITATLMKYPTLPCRHIVAEGFQPYSTLASNRANNVIKA